MRQNSIEMRKGLGNMRKRLLAAYKGNTAVKVVNLKSESPVNPILRNSLYV